MRAGKSLLFFCLLPVCYLPALAQVKFSTVITDKEIGKNDFIQVEYLVENAGSVEALTPPAFTGFTVVSGPMQQTGMRIINGNMSKSEGISYMLKPSATGKFSIAGATAVVDGKKMRSNTVTVIVTNAASRPSSSNASSFFGLPVQEEAPEINEEYLLRKGERAADKIKSNLLVKLDVSKTNCYAGEPVVATYKLCSRVRSESRVTKRPSLSQFSVYDMVQPESNSPSIETINGKAFTTHIIRKVQLYPLQDGSFDLDPVEVDNTVNFLRMENSNARTSTQQLMNDYMNGITDGKMEEEHIILSSKPVTITVKPLPAEGKPASFDGAVGKFTVLAMIPKASISANETAVLQVVLRGQGNLTLINAPQVQWPSGVEGYEPTVKENLDKTVAPINGSKLFEYSFIAKQAGRIIIPPIEFSYFDPGADAYKTIRTDALEAQIGKSLKKNRPAVSENGNEVQASPLNQFNWQKIWWLLPVLFIALLGLLFRRKNNKPVKKISSVPKAIEQEIIPADRFEGARLALVAVNSQLFYKETGKATWQLLADRFNLTTSQLNKPVVVRLLQEANASAETISLLETVLNDCELALYTPVHTETDMRHTLEKAEQLQQHLIPDR